MTDPSDLLLLGVSVVAGLVIVWLIRRLRAAEDAQRRVAATANARAERLDAILNTTADGIIVISCHGESSRRSTVAPSSCSDIPKRKWSGATSAC